MGGPDEHWAHGGRKAAFEDNSRRTVPLSPVPALALPANCASARPPPPPAPAPARPPARTPHQARNGSRRPRGDPAATIAVIATVAASMADLVIRLDELHWPADAAGGVTLELFAAPPGVGPAVTVVVLTVVTAVVAAAPAVRGEGGSEWGGVAPIQRHPPGTLALTGTGELAVLGVRAL